MRKSHSRVTVKDKISIRAYRKPQIHLLNSSLQVSSFYKDTSVFLQTISTMTHLWRFSVSKHFFQNFTLQHPMTWIAAGVTSLQNTDKVFQKSVLTCMKVTANVLSLRVESPVLKRRLFQVCSTQWLISDLPSWCLGINSLRIIRSRFIDVRNT